MRGERQEPESGQRSAGGNGGIEVAELTEAQCVGAMVEHHGRQSQSGPHHDAHFGVTSHVQTAAQHSGNGDHGIGVADVGALGIDMREDGKQHCHPGPDGGQQMGEAHHCQHHGGGGAFLPGSQYPHRQSNEEQRQTQRDGKRELPRHGGGDVAAVNCVLAVHEEHGGHCAHQDGHRPLQPRLATQGPAGDGHGHQSSHRDKLESHVVRQDETEQCNGPRGERKVEAEYREPGVPVVGPTNEAAMGQQLPSHRVGGPYMSAHVPTRGGGVAQQQGGTYAVDDNAHEHRQHHQAHHLHGHLRRYPRSSVPGGRRRRWDESRPRLVDA